MHPIESRFQAVVWRHAGDAAWHFLTIPVELADEIRAQAEPTGFGAVKVVATIGATTWATSVFPDKESGSYVLPVKAAVRRAEGLDDGTVVDVRLAPA